MKFKVTFKTTDAIETAINEKAHDCNENCEDDKISCERSFSLGEKDMISMQTVADKFSDGEYIVIEFDTETKTCIVIPRNKQ